jgi:hypothetical protein
VPSGTTTPTAVSSGTSGRRQHTATKALSGLGTLAVSRRRGHGAGIARSSSRKADARRAILFSEDGISSEESEPIRGGGAKALVPALTRRAHGTPIAADQQKAGGPGRSAGAPERIRTSLTVGSVERGSLRERTTTVWVSFLNATRLATSFAVPGEEL